MSRGTSSTRQKSPTALFRSIGRPRLASTSLPPASSALRLRSARQESVPSAALQAKNYANWQKDFSRWLAQSETLELFRHRDSKLTSHPGESERDFRIRLSDANRAARDEAVDAMRRKYATKQAQLAERLRRAEASVEREQQQVSQSRLQTMVSVGTTLVGAFLGRKAVSMGTLGRATTAVRGVGRSMKESEDVKRAGESAEAVRAQIKRSRRRDPRGDATHRRAVRERGAAREDVTHPQARAGHRAVRGARLDPGGRPDSYVIPCRRAEGTRRSDTDRAQETPGNPSPRPFGSYCRVPSETPSISVVSTRVNVPPLRAYTDSSTM